MSIELTITIRGDEKRRLSKSYLFYEPFMMTETDPVVAECLKDILEEFKGEPDDVKVRAEMILE